MAQQTVIEGLTHKITLIIDDNKRLRVENDKMSLRNDKLKTENGELSVKASQLQHRVEQLELSSALVGDQDSRKRAKARINRLMREVDRCIALMNR